MKDRQFPPIALLVHDDKVVGTDIAGASIEGRAAPKLATILLPNSSQQARTLPP